MLDLQNKIIKSKIEGAYIPVLDKDPIFAAQSLTKKDLLSSYKLLCDFYKDLQIGGKTYPILRDTIMDNQFNFNWYATFFGKIEELIEGDASYEIPFHLIPKTSGVDTVKVQQPFGIRLTRDKELKTYYLQKNVSSQIPINNYRMLYIREQFDLEDFQNDCYPGWYLLKETTVFEQYNAKTNTRVRIDFMNGEFQYYVAGASDNWEPVVDVPLEMDSVVAALLFRNN